MSARGPQHPAGYGASGGDTGGGSGAAEPPRRPSDRARALVNGLLTVLLVIGAPLVAVTFGTMAHTSATDAARVQAAERQQITARLTEDAADTGPGFTGGDLVPAAVRWTDGDGTRHTGVASVRPGAERGDTVPVWVDREGRITTAPLTPGSAAATGWLTGGMTATLFAAAVFGARTGANRLLDRRRYAEWEAEWALLEPQWSRRYHD